MAVPARYQKPDSWPHIFSPERDIHGELIEKPIWNERGPVLGKLYKCQYCKIPWWQNIDPRPFGACPKRIDLLEHKRLRGML